MNVFVLMSHEYNARLIADTVEREWVILPNDERFFADADLFIVDAPSLVKHADKLRALKASNEPVFLPVLLIASRPEAVQYDGLVTTLADDIVERPVIRKLLFLRLRALLRERAMSTRLAQSLQAERRTSQRLEWMQRLYDREHLVSESFQHAALPLALPAIPGFRLDGYYAPSRAESRLGGDWYDALRLGDGRVLLSIGDVAGSGLEAAVTMAAVRQAIRAVSHVYADPLTMLEAADRTLLAQRRDAMVTAFVAVLDPIERTLHYGSAGHPPPLLRRADGTVMELRAQGLPLGLRSAGDGSSAHTPLEHGDTLVMYTDGLSEATRSVDGEARLREAMIDGAFAHQHSPASALRHTVYGEHYQRDDVAILTLQITNEANFFYKHWRFSSHDADRATEARYGYTQALRDRGAPEESLFNCEMIFGELVSNVFRYTPGEADVYLDFSFPQPVLHVLDRGGGFTLVPRLPSDILSERGRGLYLVWNLGEDFSVDRRPDGGSHARVALPTHIHSGLAVSALPTR